MNELFIQLSTRLKWIVSVGAAIGLTVMVASGLSIASAEDTSTPATAPLEFYKVQILPKAKVGDQIHMRREIEQSTNEVTEAGGKPQAGQSGSNALQINFYGTLEVLTANKQGQPEKWKVSAGVVSIRRAGSSSKEMLLKPGTDFTVAFTGGKATVSDYDNRHPLSEDAKKYLPIVFEATGANGDASLGQILDTLSATKGVNWNVNTKAAAAELHNFDPKLKPTEVSGLARLKSVIGDGDKKVLTVEYEFTANTKKPANPPAGMTPVSATRIETGTLTLPANGSTGYFSAKSLIHTTSTYKKAVTEKEKQPAKKGAKPTTKSVKVNEETVFEQYDKVTTLLTYGNSAPPEKSESPRPSTSPSSPSSASASTTDSTPK